MDWGLIIAERLSAVAAAGSVLDVRSSADSSAVRRPVVIQLVVLRKRVGVEGWA